jgi:hypothetical protein
LACNKPLHGYRKEGGGFSLSPRGAHYDQGKLTVPCGQCAGCRVKRSREWAARCVHEASLHKANCFATLTYNKWHIPTDGSLRKSDWQLFAKKFRNRIGPFRFYMCGEYGGISKRPHYHAIIFGHDFLDDRIRIRSGEYPLYFSPSLTNLWGKGIVTLGDVNYTTAAYCAKYMMKAAKVPKAADPTVFEKQQEAYDKAYGRTNPDTGEFYHVEPEFSLMSRRPGIASDWFERFHKDVFPSDHVIVDGKRVPTPRFYDNRLDEDERRSISRRRKLKAIEFAESLTEDRLDVREAIAIDREKFFNRSL